jgi:uncharacterized membrane protein
MIIAALALIGVFVASYLTLYKIGVIGQLTCSIHGCETVNSSHWATFLGIPVAAWGVAFYVALFVVAIIGATETYEDALNISQALTLMSGVGVLFSAWLTYLELFVIHAVCMWCVTSAVIVTTIFLFSLRDLREKRIYSGDEEATLA